MYYVFTMLEDWAACVISILPRDFSYVQYIVYKDKEYKQVPCVILRFIITPNRMQKISHIQLNQISNSLKGIYLNSTITVNERRDMCLDIYLATKNLEKVCNDTLPLSSNNGKKRKISNT